MPPRFIYSLVGIQIGDRRASIPLEKERENLCRFIRKSLLRRPPTRFSLEEIREKKSLVDLSPSNLPSVGESTNLYDERITFSVILRSRFLSRPFRKSRHAREKKKDLKASAITEEVPRI